VSTTILIADDDPVQRRLLEAAIVKMGYRTLTADNGHAALEHLRGPQAKDVDAMVLDLVMPELDGMGVLAEMRDTGINVPAIVQTAQGGIETVVNAMRAGAQDFVVKPVSPERLSVSIQNALKLGALEAVVQTIRKTSAGTFTFDDMIGSSPAMLKAMKLGERGAASNIPVLIEGESGVGKEVIAKAIQGTSDRRGKPFVTVNCGALPENLVESILFGHEKGSFTGATHAHVGKFKEADGGTLFLDEVGELTLDLQVKLLRAIQEGEIDPVGSKRPVKTDFRLISATNRDMIEQVKRGEFREDLYYRLNVFPIQVPPLRERKSDISALVQHFTTRICLEEGRRGITGIANDALAMLEAYDWPGNIRQLENMIFRAIILCDGDELTINEFPQIAASMDIETTVAETQTGNSVIQFSNLAAPAKSKASLEPASTPLLHTDGELRSMEEVEADMIRFAIDHHKGRMTRVARSLGIGRSTLYRKLKELGLEDNADSSEDDAA